MRRLAALAALAVAGVLAGCGTVPSLPGVTPYRIEIQQGNFISQEMVAQLRPGMTREQVRFVLGTPLVTDIFHSDRWDYVYFREAPGKPRERRNLSVFFEDGKLVRLAGDVVPAAPAEASAPPAAKPAATAPPKPAPEALKPPVVEQAKPVSQAEKPAAEAPAERGFFGRIIDKLKGSE